MLTARVCDAAQDEEDGQIPDILRPDAQQDSVAAMPDFSAAPAVLGSTQIRCRRLSLMFAPCA